LARAFRFVAALRFAGVFVRAVREAVRFVFFAM